jgi:hypothetical protein
MSHRGRLFTRIPAKVDRIRHHRCESGQLELSSGVPFVLLGGRLWHKNGGHMMDMTTMSAGPMVVMAIYHVAIFIFALLGIAASIKYLRS